MKNNPNKIPENWVWTNLVEVCEYVKTGVDDFFGTKEYYSTGSIKNNIYTSEGEYSFNERPSRANRIAIKGDVFQARMKNTSKALLIKDKLNNKLFSTGFIQLRPLNCCVDMSPFLYYFIQSPLFINQRDALSTGSTQIALTDRAAKQIIFPLAPISEQYRIVSKIEELLNRLDQGVKYLLQTQQQLELCLYTLEWKIISGEFSHHWRKQYENNVAVSITSMKRDILPNIPEKWKWHNLGDVASHEKYSITDGPFGSNLKTEHYTNLGPRVIRLQNIGKGIFIDKESHISYDHYEKLLKHRVYPNDLIIAILGKDMPRSCIMPNNIGPAIVKADCIRFKPNIKKVDISYLNYILNTIFLSKYVKNIIHGVGRPRINLKQLKSLPIPIPPINEQKYISYKISVVLTIINRVNSEIHRMLHGTSKLKQSIFMRAFEGRLVPQDPDDESASVLLERIKVEEAKLKSTGNHGRKRGRIR